MIGWLKRHQVQQVAFAGGISRVSLFGSAKVKLDWRALKVIARTGSIRDDAILRGISGELESVGFQVISAAVFLRESIASGQITRRKLTASERNDAVVGWRAAHAIGLLDIGQTVVVKDSVIVAVEAVEGTDEAILRAGRLVGPGSIVVKLAKPQQDMRLDMPAVGEKTLAAMAQAGAKALVLEEQRAIIIDPERVRRTADDQGVAIQAFASAEALTVSGLG